MPIESPKDIYNVLNKSVIGQDKAKKILSVAMYDHYIRCKHPELLLDKTNVLLLGPTGTGKTLMAKTLAKALHIPIAIADATSLTQAGYVGEDVENCLLRLYQAADGDVALTENGVCFIDEIDKLGRKSESPSITRDVSGEGVQQALLKLIEGSKVNVPADGGRKRPDGVGYIPMDTSNILFICAGAFEGLSYKKTITTTDLERYGMMPELLGRLPVKAQLEELTCDDMMRIITEPTNSILSQYRKQFYLRGIDLTFEESALKKIAQYAVDQKIGARGLRSVFEELLLDYKFDPGDRINLNITKEFVEVKLKIAPIVPSVINRF